MTAAAALSAGERQRVALARLFLRDAPLLLLDEPTANLDGATEDEVLAAVRRLMRGTDRDRRRPPARAGRARRPRRRPQRERGAGMSALTAAQATRPPRIRATAGRGPVGAAVCWHACSGLRAVGAGIGLLATAAWLISRAAQHPHESALAIGIVAVQFFGLSKGLFRYGQRLVGHDAALRALADLRVRVYAAPRAARAGRPAGVSQRRPDGAVRRRRRLTAGPAGAGDRSVRDRDRW